MNMKKRTESARELQKQCAELREQLKAELDTCEHYRRTIRVLIAAGHLDSKRLEAARELAKR